jgi:hypothetical protein
MLLVRGSPGIEKKYKGNKSKLGTEGTSEAFKLARYCGKTAGAINHGRNDGAYPQG